MSRIGVALTALLLATLGATPYDGDCPSKDGPNCVDCWEDWTELICELGTGEPECHMTHWFGEPDMDTWDGLCEATRGSHDGDLAAGTCEMNHEYIGGSCYSDEDQEDGFTAAIDGLENATTFGEASRTLKAFQDIKGVWVEFNARRNALQVLSDGECNSVTGGQVIKHLSVGEDLAVIWKEVLHLS